METSPSRPSPSRDRTKVWWVGALAVAGALFSGVAAAACLTQGRTEIWNLPTGGGTEIQASVVTNSGMVAWGITALVCALAYVIAAVFAFTRGLSTRSWLPLVCLVFPAVMALWAAMTFTEPVG